MQLGCCWPSARTTKPKLVTICHLARVLLPDRRACCSELWQDLTNTPPSHVTNRLVILFLTSNFADQALPQDRQGLLLVQQQPVLEAFTAALVLSKSAC
jgi:hypothetical protein